MASIGRKLKMKGVIATTLLTLVLIGTGCEDKIDTPAVNPSENKTVEVSMTIGLSDEVDSYDLSASTKSVSAKKNAVDIELVPSIATRTTTAKPDKLYKLEIRQYSQEGKYLNGNGPTDQTIGGKLTVNLTEAKDCQLVFVAWGVGSSNSLGSKTFSEAQKVSIDASTIGENINTMPYVLHLKHVNVIGSGASGTISSPDGKDVRILLKRLATRLTISWDYKVTGYTLKQIILQSIPLSYKVVAAPSENNTYPSEMDQFTNIQLTEEQVKNQHYTCWIPANVRGFNTASNSPLYRIKANAPIGSAYASFIAVNDADFKKKFNYRVYLGGKDYSDFNLYENTDYSYKVNFNHTGIPTNDRRVTYIDAIPASDNNKNFVNTANCFMVAPGGYFNFNPYKYYIDGKVEDNALLQGWSQSSKIKSVKVLWQTLENGDIGDPVLGTVNSSDNHTNIVEIENGDNFETARVYCRIAPNTEGGSGVIAAYDGENGTGNILWSWHIWVTDYSPDAKTDISVDDPNKRVQKYTYGGKIQNPMMDRHLGAKAGYTDIPESILERSKANGFHYQWGRKDPFPSSYSAVPIRSIIINNDQATLGMLNLYQPDGVSYFVRKAVNTSVSIQVAYQNPTVTYVNQNPASNLWNDNDNKKTVHDPCPSGWRIASKVNYRALFTNISYEGESSRNEEIAMNLANSGTIVTDGGAVLYFENNSSGRSTYLRMTGYQENPTQFNYIGGMGNIWCRESGRYALVFMEPSYSWNGKSGHNISSNLSGRDGHSIRCIQDR